MRSDILRSCQAAAMARARGSCKLQELQLMNRRAVT
jgi:hypothetical protein